MLPLKVSKRIQRAAVVASLMFPAGLAHAASPGDLGLKKAACQNERLSAQQRLDACTALLADPSGAASDRSNWLYWRSSAHSDRQDYASALKDATERVSVLRNASTLAHRAHFYEKLGRLDEAIADLTEAIAHPSDLDAQQLYHLVLRGNLYAAQKKYPEAIRDYTAAIDRKMPAYLLSTLYLVRSYAHEANGDNRSAKADYKMHLSAAKSR